MTEDEMGGWHHQLNGHEFEQTLGDSECQGSLVCCSPWGLKELDMTDCTTNSLCILSSTFAFPQVHYPLALFPPAYGYTLLFLFQFSGTVKIKYHSLGDLEMCFFTVLEARSPRPRCWQGEFLLRSLPWGHKWLSCPCAFTWSFLYVCIPVSLLVLSLWLRLSLISAS